jgi:citrate lyase subunit beta/citryl-CoA lyase
MVSTDNEKHISKIPNLETDTVILNLEDGVGEKEKALKNCKKILKEFERTHNFVVRINSLDSGGVKEIEELNPFKPDAIRIPKIRTAKDVDLGVDLISKEIDIHLSIETKEAWLNLAQLRRESRVSTFYLGILDLFADLGLSQNLLSPESDIAKYILSHFLITSKALGVNPVSFVYQNYQNRDKFLEWLQLEKRMGYNSKGALSPTQANDIREALGVSDREIERAKEIKRLFEENSQKGVNGFSHIEYGFIDEPIYKGALATLKILSK